MQRHIGEAAAYVARETGRKLQSSSDGALRYLGRVNQFDSPLEVLFWVWWGAALTLDLPLDDLFGLSGQREVTVPNGSQYRVDFVIEPRSQDVATSPAWTPLAVELDGHEFHERTRDQVALRDRRDRELQTAGGKVFHFSFAEFTNNPMACVLCVLDFARDQHNRVTMLQYAARRAETAAHDQEAVPVGDSGV